HVAFGEQVAFHLPMTITTDSFIVGPIGVPLPLPVLNFGSVQFQIDSLTQKLVGDDIVLGLAVSVLRSSDNALLRRPNTATDFEKFQNTYNSGPLRSYNDWGLELDQWLVERLVESLDDSVFPSNMTDVAITFDSITEEGIFLGLRATVWIRVDNNPNIPTPFMPVRFCADLRVTFDIKPAQTSTPARLEAAFEMIGEVDLCGRSGWLDTIGHEETNDEVKKRGLKRGTFALGISPSIGNTSDQLGRLTMTDIGHADGRLVIFGAGSKQTLEPAHVAAEPSRVVLGPSCTNRMTRVSNVWLNVFGSASTEDPYVCDPHIRGPNADRFVVEKLW